MSVSRQNRMDNLIRDPEFDVIVIGGGVNGIGVYRDLALQGLRVLLVERNDFCSGCSAAPSRMIHGGLRYLENGEFDLVRESLQERDALLRNAPHMVRPLPTMIPISSWFSGLLNAPATFFGWTDRPTNRGGVPIKLGLGLYDWVTRQRRAMPRHKFLSGKRVRKDWPDLTPNTRMAAVYYDAWISHPERLCIEMLNDVEKVSPTSVALNYTELQPAAGGGYVLSDHCAGQKHPVRPQTIVYATGAWLDDTRRDLGEKHNEQMVSGTKGSHLILKNDQLFQALDGHMVYFENEDGRVCIVFPYQGNVLAGSTDIRVETACRVRCEPDELLYILESLRLVFPEIPLSEEQVVFSYSGIRPLPKSEHGFTGRISRGHFTKRIAGEVPQFCMVGGKWTTFRAFAEQTADMVLAELGRDRKVSTIDLAIGGGAGFGVDGKDVEKALLGMGLSQERARHLLDHYGSSSMAIAEHCAARDRDRPLAVGCSYSEAEIGWLIEQEQVETISDLVLRRTALAITGQISSEIIYRVGEIIARERGLDAATVAAQQQTLIEELAQFHGVCPDTLASRSKERRQECA